MTLDDYFISYMDHNDANFVPHCVFKYILKIDILELSEINHPKMSWFIHLYIICTGRHLLFLYVRIWNLKIVANKDAHKTHGGMLI